MKLYNHFETGTLGARIIAYGSSNPYPWDFVDGSDTTTIYDNTHCRGLMAGKFLTGGASAKAMAEWDPGGPYGVQTEVYGRMYVWLSSNPPSISALTTVVDSGGSMACRVLVLTDGKLRITDGVSVTVATSSVSIPLGQWVRLEWHIVHSATAGTFEMRAYWTDPEAAVGSYDLVLSGSSLNTIANSQGAQFGWCQGAANLPTLWIDAIQVNTSGWIGPSLNEPAATFIAWRSPVLGPIDQSSESQAAVSDFITRIYQEVGRFSFIPAPRRQGPLSLRAEIRQFDSTGGGGSERNTLNRVLPIYSPGDDFWFGISVLVDPTYPPGVHGDWMILYQLFGMTGGTSTGSPPFALEIGSDDYFTMSVRGGAKASPGATAPKQSFQDIAPIVKGVWHDFLFHIHLSLGSDGSVDCYYKLASNPSWPATPTVSDTGVNVLTVGGVVQLVFNSLNVYRATRPEIGVVYFGLAVIQPERSLVEQYFDSTINVGLPMPVLLEH